MRRIEEFSRTLKRRLAFLGFEAAFVLAHYFNQTIIQTVTVLSELLRNRTYVGEVVGREICPPIDGSCPWKSKKATSSSETENRDELNPR